MYGLTPGMIVINIFRRHSYILCKPTEACQLQAMIALHRHRRGDVRVSLIIDDLEIFELVIEDGFRFAPDDQLRRRERLAAELKPRLFQMVQVDVTISPGPDELADIKTALLGDHMSQQRV